MLAKALSRYWWLATLRGLVAIVFGVVAAMAPLTAIKALVVLFGVFALVEGALSIVTAVSARKSEDDWWLLLVEGLIAVAIGAAVFLQPVFSTVVLLLYIAAWAIVVGAMRIGTAIRLRQEMKSEGWLAFGGVISILLGVLLFARPAAGILALATYVGAWAIIQGLSLCMVGFELRRLSRPAEREEHEIPTFGAPVR